jgi:hypothetical protein
MREGDQQEARCECCEFASDGRDCICAHPEVKAERRRARLTSHGEGDEARRELLKRIERVVGYPPVGMGDLLNVLTHPDVLPLTRAWLNQRARLENPANAAAPGPSLPQRVEGEPVAPLPVICPTCGWLERAPEQWVPHDGPCGEECDRGETGCHCAPEVVAPLPSTSEALKRLWSEFYVACGEGGSAAERVRCMTAIERAISAAAMAEAQVRIEARDNDEAARTEGYEARVRPAHYAVYHDQDWYNAGWTDALRALLAPVETQEERNG